MTKQQFIEEILDEVRENGEINLDGYLLITRKPFKGGLAKSGGTEFKRSDSYKLHIKALPKGKKLL